jgi:post-segregation antitoxin (ccd killing protein)
MAKPGMVKITVYVPEDLMRRAMKVSGLGITATVRLALQGLVMQAESIRITEEKSRLKPRRSGGPPYFLRGG